VDNLWITFADLLALLPGALFAEDTVPWIVSRGAGWTTLWKTLWITMLITR